MRTTTVFATASSTMHADLIVVGLKRLGIPTSGVSVLYPTYSQPDTVVYWLDGSARLAMSPSGQTVAVSGPLRVALEQQYHGEDGIPPLVQGLRSLGLTNEQSHNFESALLNDRIVIGINTSDDSELALVIHILHHIGAEKIVIAETPVAERMHISAKKQPLSLSAA